MTLEPLPVKQPLEPSDTAAIPDAVLVKLPKSVEFPKVEIVMYSISLMATQPLYQHLATPQILAIHYK